MEFDQLRTLVAVLDHGSFTRAATALGLSQSTISFHIKGLEQDVGARLIDRGRDGVKPTSHGRLLRRYADQLLALRDEAESTLGAHARGAMGRVAVAASTIPGEYLLPPALPRLREEHPEISVTVRVSDSRRAITSLLAGECDLAAVGSAMTAVDHPPSGLRSVKWRRFASDEIVLVAPKPSSFTLPAADDLSGVPLVLRQEGSGTREAVAEILAASLHGRRLGPTIEVGSTEAAKRCIMAGLGLGFVSKVAIERELERGELQIVERPGLPVARDFFIATRKGSTLSPAAAALVQALT